MSHYPAPNKRTCETQTKANLPFRFEDSLVVFLSDKDKYRIRGSIIQLKRLLSTLRSQTVNMVTRVYQEYVEILEKVIINDVKVGRGPLVHTLGRDSSKTIDT